MKNFILRSSALTVLVMLLFASQAEAQCTRQDPNDPTSPLINLDGTPCTNTVLSGVPFLRIVADARSGAMGDAGLAISADPNAMHFNASKLAFAEETFAMSATYTPWLQSLGLNDVYLAYLTGFYKLDELQTLGFGLRYFSLGSIQFTDNNGEPLQMGQPNEFEVAAAYARKLTDNFSASLTGKFIYSNLAAGQQLDGGEIIEPGVAGAADIAFTYQTDVKSKRGDAGLVVALALTNIGSKITYTNSLVRDFLPANMGLGAAYTIELDQYNKFTFATDINKLMVPTPCQAEACVFDDEGIDERRRQSPIAGVLSSFGDAPGGFSEEITELMYSFGMEYWYDNQFAVRAGYYNEHLQKGGRKFFTVGLGLKYNIFGLNFSYLVPTTNQRNPLDNTLRFSMIFDFGNMSELE